MKRQFCHAKFQKSNQKPIFISQNSIIMETDKCLFALIYIFQKLSGLIYLRNSFRFCVQRRYRGMKKLIQFEGKFLQPSGLYSLNLLLQLEFIYFPPFKVSYEYILYL